MVFTSPIFRKLLLSTFLLTAVTLVALDFCLTRRTAERQVEYLQEQCRAEGRILVAGIKQVPPEEFKEWVAGAEIRPGVRVTVINSEGVVVADSQRGPKIVENYSDWPEVQEAIRGREGSLVRYSRTANRDLCYVAVPFSYQGKSGYVLEIAASLEPALKAASGTHRRIPAELLVAFLLALAVAYPFSRSFVRRINRVKFFAENLEKTASPGRIPSNERDELGELERSLELTASRLRELVNGLSLESARRERILASMVEGVLAVDAGLRVTFCNDSFLRAAGASGPLPERLPLLEIVREPGLVDMFTRVLASGKPARRRLDFPVREGRSFEVQVSPLAAPSGAGAIAILHDVTDLERLERVRRDFVANVSHELRTPLTAIRGYAETLLEGGLEDEDNNRRFVEIIKSHAVRLSNIASDLLMLSDLESTKPAAEPERLSVRAALETAIRTVEPEAKLRGVVIACGPLDDATVLGERGRLEQALVNLLDNAVKFNRPGGKVQIEIRREPEGKTRIVVADTGIGIPSTDLSRIFERFYRVDKTRSREMGGTGLGLSIVRHVIERMNGAVSVESVLGKGSAFTIVLPSVPVLPVKPA